MELENVSDEFIDWLDKCPVQWFLIGQDENSLNYQFMKQLEEIE